jgi:hypothetical protein
MRAALGVYGGSLTSIPDPDFALKSDPAIYEKLERDPEIKLALRLRVLSVVGQSWHCEPGTDAKPDAAVAEIMEALLGEVREFSASRAELFHGGFVSGRGYAWTRGDRGPVRGLGSRTWWRPRRLIHQDKRRFSYFPEHSVDARGRRRIRKVLKYWPLTSDSLTDTGLVELPPEIRRALICLTYDDREDQLGQGRGVATPLYLYLRAKSMAWMMLNQGGEKWGRGGIVVAKVGTDREGSQTNEQLVEEWLDVIDMMQSRHALVFGHDDEVNVLSPSSEGVAIPLQIMEYCDRAMLRLITGSLRTTGGNTEYGSNSQGEVEQETAEILVQADRELLDEALTTSLVRCVWDLNRGNFAALGLGGASMPKFVTSVERVRDPEVSVRVIYTALQAGIPIRKRDVYELLSIQPPAPGEPVFTTPVPPDVASVLDGGSGGSGGGSDAMRKISRATSVPGTPDPVPFAAADA